jgi:hypothetical protein
MNPHDQYFAAQRVSLAPHTANLPVGRKRRRPASVVRAFLLGAAMGAATVWLRGDALAADPFTLKACEVDAMTARQLAEARDAGTPEARAHARLDALAASHPELALSDADVRREHAFVSEIWALSHLAPDTVHVLMLHRCLFGKTRI